MVIKYITSEYDRQHILLTNNHHIEVETFPDTLAVPLVREVGKSHIARQLSSDDILVVIDNRTGRRRGCRFHVRNVKRWRRN